MAKVYSLRREISYPGDSLRRVHCTRNILEFGATDFYGYALRILFIISISFFHNSFGIFDTIVYILVRLYYQGVKYNGCPSPPSR